MLESLTALTRSDLDLASIVGEVERCEGHIIVRQPENPTYRWGNFVLLDAPPDGDALEHWIANPPEDLDRVHLRWDGADVSAATARRVAELEMSSDVGLEMIAHGPPVASACAASDIEIRPLDAHREQDEIVALNKICDPTEQDGAEGYCVFKERLRKSWWAYCDSGRGQWWGAFRGARLLGQCGLVSCSDGLARFQSVETHPEARRQGICSKLIAHVGRDAVERRRARALLLGVDPDGPALGLYARLGFVKQGWQRSLLYGATPRAIRAARPGDVSEVASLTRAAFRSVGEDGAEEVRVLEALYATEGAQVLICERPGTMLGYVALSPVTIDGSQGAAIGPLAVRPSQQRSGVGSALVRAAIETCRQRGDAALFVVGDPEYYSRFGFESAAEAGFETTFDLPPGVFQWLALGDGEGAGGFVRFAPAFG